MSQINDNDLTAIDAAVAAKVNLIVYTSIVGTGKKYDTYEVNEHVWI